MNLDQVVVSSFSLDSQDTANIKSGHKFPPRKYLFMLSCTVAILMRFSWQEDDEALEWKGGPTFKERNELWNCLDFRAT